MPVANDCLPWLSSVALSRIRPSRLARISKSIASWISGSRVPQRSLQGMLRTCYLLVLINGYSQRCYLLMSIHINSQRCSQHALGTLNMHIKVEADYEM